ncbi:MAG: hypothetical protein IK093_19140, partial [Ruminiclostridium sp.]|nr:hypothetical protein [Ruminiclostridium sp.]
YADPKSMRLFLNEAQKGVVSDLSKRAMERTLKEMRDAYGADKINKCINDKGVFFTKDSLIMKHYNRVLTEYVEMYKRNDPVCQSAQQALQDAADGLEGLSQDDLYPIAKTTDALVTAYDYLKNHVKAEMPNYVVRIDLRTDLGGTSGYTTYEKLIGNPYCVIDVGSTDHIKALPLTLTHELFHAIQRKYVSKPMANFKFDEALAQAVEYEAYEYFTEKKIIDLPKRETLVELYSYDDYALPLDQYSSMRNLTISYPEGTHTAYDTTSCYPAAGLILYLRGIYPDISYTDILKTYGRMWMNGKFTDILKTVYPIDNSGLEAVYYTFAAKDAPYFYASAIERQNDSGFAPKTVVNTREPTEVKGSGQEYVIRVRQINVNKRKSSDEQFALVLLYDKENTEHHLLPVEATEDRHYSNIKNGIFLHPKEFETGKPSTDMIPDFDSSSLKDISPVDWYIIEPNTVPVSASKNQYKIYPVYAPDTPVVDAKDSKLEITFPDPKNSPSYETAEGYAVKVYSGNEYEGAVTVQFDELDDKFRWTQDDIDLESFENPKITICEYFGKSSDGEELFGPETEKIDLIGGYSGRWVLSGTKSYSEREAFEIEGSKTEKYTANGSTFTSYSESYSKNKDGTYAYRNIDSSTCSFTGIPNSANPGETFTVKANVTVSQSAYKATGDSKDLGMCCNVTDAEVEKFLNDTWTRDDHVGKTDLDGADVEWDRISDTEDRYAVTFPNEKGDTGKIVIVIEYSYYARTVYTYTWQPMG